VGSTVSIPQERARYTEPSTVTPRPLDPTTHPYAQKYFQDHLDSLPAGRYGLGPNDFEAIGRATNQFNCFADSLRDYQNWVVPGVSNMAFDEMYADQGFVPLAKGEITEADLAPIDGFEKVVLFGAAEGTPAAGAFRFGEWSQLDREYTDRGLAIPEPRTMMTHAIIQEPDGSWHTKMGGNAMLRIHDPNLLSGGSYGEPVAVYVRPRRDFTPFDESLVTEFNEPNLQGAA
jgi:hypothetical protein